VTLKGLLKISQIEMKEEGRQHDIIQPRQHFQPMAN